MLRFASQGPIGSLFYSYQLGKVWQAFGDFLSHKVINEMVYLPYLTTFVCAQNLPWCPQFLL